jgi:hypothetical protein
MELEMEALRSVATLAAKAIKGIWEPRVVPKKLS